MATASREQTRAREMEQQIAYLRWKKMQNDREIKKAIVVSRALKKKDEVLSLSQNSNTSERFGWAHAVVRDELQRPLVISDAELYYLQSEEVKNKNRLTKYADRHLRIIENSEEEIAKKEYYNEVARQTQEEKLQILKCLKRDVKDHMREVSGAAPIIRTHSPIPKLFH